MYADFIKTIDTGDVPGLGPEPRTSSLTIAKLEEALHAFDLRGSTIGLARSAAFLWHDHLDASHDICLLYTSPSPRDRTRSRMPSSA